MRYRSITALNCGVVEVKIVNFKVVRQHCFIFVFHAESLLSDKLLKKSKKSREKQVTASIETETYESKRKDKNRSTKRYSDKTKQLLTTRKEQKERPITL